MLQCAPNLNSNMIEDRVRITYRELDASQRPVICCSAQVIVATGRGGSGGKGRFPVPALATSRTAVVARREVAPLCTGGSSSSSSHTSNNKNTSMFKAVQARTEEVPVRGTRTGSRNKPGRGRIRTPVAVADISHGHHSPTTAAVKTSRGRKYARHASSRPEGTHFVPTTCTTPPCIPLTYIDYKAPSQEFTPLTPAQGVSSAARQVIWLRTAALS